jgi:hypothetical protein
MSGESAFFDVVGGDASTGYTTEGVECGLAIVPLPDGPLRITLAVDGPPQVFHLSVDVSHGLAAEWGLLLSGMARGAAS